MFSRQHKLVPLLLSARCDAISCVRLLLYLVNPAIYVSKTNNSNLTGKSMAHTSKLGKTQEIGQRQIKRFR